MTKQFHLVIDLDDEATRHDVALALDRVKRQIARTSEPLEEDDEAPVRGPDGETVGHWVIRTS